MKITLDHIGKSFNKEWIFRNISSSVLPERPLAILGNNGSGKSTLLQILASQIYSTEGKITYEIHNQTISAEKVYQLISFAAPYQELIEELTLKEHVLFHRRFKKFRNNIHEEEFISMVQLEKHKNKPVSKFSSGMKQRLKLALAILSDTPFLFLDEPVSNLDSDSINWFKELLTTHNTNRITVISSNQHHDEIFCCTESLDVRKFKP